MAAVLACRVFGHRFRFSARGVVMTWECQRACGAGGSKTYSSPAAARQYAVAFDREDRAQLGRRAPLIGLFPLRLWYRLRHRDDQPMDDDGQTTMGTRQTHRTAQPGDTTLERRS